MGTLAPATTVPTPRPATRPGRAVARAVSAMVALAPLVACGSGDTGGAHMSMTVVGTEMAFDAPERVAEGTYEVVFRNDGTVHHELAFRNPDGDIVARRSIPGGRSVTMEVELEPGTWELGCFEPGHYEAGMFKPLVVEEG